MSAGYVSEVRTGHGLLWHVGRGLPRWNGDRGEGTAQAWKGEAGDWLDQRREKEREALEGGRGLGDVIADQARGAFGVEKGQ